MKFKRKTTNNYINLCIYLVLNKNTLAIYFIIFVAYNIKLYKQG